MENMRKEENGTIDCPNTTLPNETLQHPFYPAIYRNIEYQSQTAQIMWLVAQVIYYTGITGNICVIIVVILDKKLHKITFVVLACLAVSDALALIFQCILMSLLFAETIDIFSTEASLLILCLNFALLISSLHILYISVLRYFIIVHPLKTYVHLTTRRAILGSVAIFITLPIVSVALYFSFMKLTDLDQFHFLLTAGLFYYTPILVMTGFHIAKCRNLQRRKLHTDEDSLKKMSHTILVIILISYILPIPSIAAGMQVLMGASIPIGTVIICDVCFYAKHALNPFIYCFMSPVFRGSLKNIVMYVVRRFKFKDAHSENKI